MLVIGRVFKTGKYKDANGKEHLRITLLDETPDGESAAQFFNFVSDDREFELGQFVSFKGRILQGKAGNSFFAVEKETVEILPER